MEPIPSPPSEAVLSTLAERTRALPSTRIAEVVLQTARFDALKRWYAAVLGGRWAVENDPSRNAAIAGEHGDGGKQVHAARVRSCFMILDEDAPISPPGQLFALFEIPGIGLTHNKEPGMNHMQFKHRSLEDLVRRVELLRDAGVHPHRSANHGPITSFYFRDPDDNIVELCVNNFDTFEDFRAYFDSDDFKRNPSGIDMQRDDFLARFHSGMPRHELLSIPK